MLGTHSELCSSQMSHICDISPLRDLMIKTEIWLPHVQDDKYLTIVI